MVAVNRSLEFLRQLHARPHVAAPLEFAKLLHYRIAPDAVLATINDAGVIRLLRLQTVDHPELMRLGADDRAVLTAAVMAKHRGEGHIDGQP